MNEAIKKAIIECAKAQKKAQQSQAKLSKLLPNNLFELSLAELKNIHFEMQLCEYDGLDRMLVSQAIENYETTPKP